MMMMSVMIRMMRTTYLLLITLCILCLAVISCRGSVWCSEGQYRTGARCQACSACPINHIIRRPCTQYSNTLCGPFSEFLQFHQAPRAPSAQDTLLPLLADDVAARSDQAELESHLPRGHTPSAYDNRSKKPPVADAHHQYPDLEEHAGGNHPEQTAHQRGKSQAAGRTWQHKHQQKHQGGTGQVVLQASYDTGAGRVPAAGRSGSEPQAPSVKGPAEDDVQSQWKVLALALMVVLCVVCLFLIAVVFVVCYMKARTAHCKQMFSSATTTDHAARTVIRQSNPAYRASLHNVPVLTTHARQAQTGSSMTRVPSGGPCVNNEDYDADNSGQTISTAKSSDYVYFRSPHNGNDVIDM